MYNICRVTGRADICLTPAIYQGIWRIVEAEAPGTTAAEGGEGLLSGALRAPG